MRLSCISSVQTDVVDIDDLINMTLCDVKYGQMSNVNRPEDNLGCGTIIMST